MASEVRRRGHVFDAQTNPTSRIEQMTELVVLEPRRTRRTQCYLLLVAIADHAYSRNYRGSDVAAVGCDGMKWNRTVLPNGAIPLRCIAPYLTTRLTYNRMVIY